FLFNLGKVAKIFIGLIVIFKIPRIIIVIKRKININVNTSLINFKEEKISLFLNSENATESST
ncbi:hypothetical protein DUH76_01280, partial [Campylobacter jejuni]|nr:hypothetical protein [Campylobacter jejuni]